MIRARAAAFASLWLPALAAAQGCALPGGQALESVRYSLAYRTEPPQLAVGKHFAVEIAVCAKDNAPPPQDLRVDANMPEHRHGMNYKAAVKDQGAGRYRAEGLMFHMPGRWELVFDIRASGTTERLTRSTVLE